MKRSDLMEIIETMRDAGRAVVNNWASGDLAAAVRDLDAALVEADRAVEWWESDE